MGCPSFFLNVQLDLFLSLDTLHDTAQLLVNPVLQRLDKEELDGYRERDEREIDRLPAGDTRLWS